MITFYLANRPEMDTYLAETEKLGKRRARTRTQGELQQRLAQTYQESLSKKV